MNALLQALQGVGASRILVLLIVSASVIGLLGYFGTRLTKPPMTILYGDLDPKDAGQIVTKLETMTIPYELRAGGTQVFVPTDKVLRLRMAMANRVTLSIRHSTSLPVSRKYSAMTMVR